MSADGPRIRVEAAGRDRGEVSLFVSRVADLVKGAPVTCAPATSVADAARLMKRRAVSAVVVVGDDGLPLGIVTDRDFGADVVAAELGMDTPVTVIMSSPLLTIDVRELAFHALLEMTRWTIHHLGVTEHGRFVGVVSSDDLMRSLGAHPVALAHELEVQDSLDGLVAAAPQILAVVRWLVGTRAGPFDIGRVVAELHDRVVRRTLALVETALAAAGHGPPPVVYSWCTAGSGGRAEQALKTDQDNGLVYDDPPDDLQASAAAYFGRLAPAVVGTLARCGLPLCDGGFMASTPTWCQPQSVWRGYFDSWMAAPEPEQVLRACIYFDLRPVAADPRPGRALWDWVCDHAPSRTVFLRWMARFALDHTPPLGLFGRFVVDGSGEHRSRFDIKARGLYPVIQAMRVCALSLGVRETNTMDRLTRVGDGGTFTPGEIQELRESYEVICRVRLQHQVRCLDDGVPPDNFVDPKLLGKADRMLLREAFKTVRWLQEAIQDRFQTQRL